MEITSSLSSRILNIHQIIFNHHATGYMYRTSPHLPVLKLSLMLAMLEQKRGALRWQIRLVILKICISCDPDKGCLLTGYTFGDSYSVCLRAARQIMILTCSMRHRFHH